MTNIKGRSIVVFIFLLIYTYHCVRIIPERAKIIYANKEYVENATLNVRRYGRKADYVANLELMIKKPVENNVTIDIVFYEFLHNEFRKSFIEMHFKLCDLILQDPYLGMIMRQSGINKCPLLPGKLSLTNITFKFDYVTSVWPFEKGKIELTASFKDKAVIGSGELVCSFKS